MASPKTYITYARLLWAAYLGELPALTIGDIADRLEASSPQSFCRTVRLVLALTPTDFRRRYDGPAMLERFRHQLIAPYRVTLQTFDPVARRNRVCAIGRAGRVRAARRTLECRSVRVCRGYTVYCRDQARVLATGLR
ncbi:MAG: hypothetical protein ACREA0_25150 [bacterium]